ncbi:AIR synthase family protein [Parapedobacter lycopersici]|uniref:AIR synthase family protein n=1 Tax=Parapedobacter lycopersici TaxID=1864939 RepID=UPI00333F0EF9
MYNSTMCSNSRATTTGKLTGINFDNWVSGRCGSPRREVRIGPRFGVDVSIVDLPGDMVLAQTSDPLSLIPSLGLQESAWLSVHLMANDMATTGHAPQYGQFVLNLPPSLSTADFKAYWGYIDRYCTDIGVAITGGHTGFIAGQESTIAGGGTLTAVLPKATTRVSSMARVGDTLLVTKYCGISSAAILAMSFPHTVKDRCGVEIHREACNAFYQTSSLRDALAAVNTGEDGQAVSAMHDVTEGGVLGALHELAVASGNGAIVYHSQLPVAPAQTEVCAVFDLDPYSCIGAGAMIIACRPAAAGSIIARLSADRIPCVEVGRLCASTEGIQLEKDGARIPFTRSQSDPYWAAFFNAHQTGLK